MHQRLYKRGGTRCLMVGRFIKTAYFAYATKNCCGSTSYTRSGKAHHHPDMDDHSRKTSQQTGAGVDDWDDSVILSSFETGIQSFRTKVPFMAFTASNLLTVIITYSALSCMRFVCRISLRKLFRIAKHNLPQEPVVLLHRVCLHTRSRPRLA